MQKAEIFPTNAQSWIWIFMFSNLYNFASSLWKIFIIKRAIKWDKIKNHGKNFPRFYVLRCFFCSLMKFLTRLKINHTQKAFQRFHFAYLKRRKNKISHSVEEKLQNFHRFFVPCLLVSRKNWFNDLLLWKSRQILSLNCSTVLLMQMQYLCSEEMNFW